MNLVIDAGNTCFKYAFFRLQKIVACGFGPEPMFQEITKIKARGEKLSVLLSGSGHIDEELRVRLCPAADDWLDAATGIRYPIRIAYLTPETLGVDRVANCIGAQTLFPGKELLVIGSGTAITYNYVDRNGTFLGGNIAPGQEIRFRSLHLFTEKLPYVESGEGFGDMGLTTREAIVNGVMNGILFEISTYIDRFYQKAPQGQVLLTGGNSGLFREKLQKQVCWEENLGFIGLNQILEYNKKHD